MYHRTTDQDFDYDRPIWTGPSPNAVIDHLEMDVRHHFVIRAFDGEMESSDSDEVSIVMATTPAVGEMEFGDVGIDHRWTRVDFDTPFDRPVVVAGPMGSGDETPATIRIRNVEATGFEIRVQAWKSDDSIHGKETVSYLVMEEGRYTLPDGTIIQAARAHMDTTNGYGKIAFGDRFDVTPVVMASITSLNDPNPVTIRVRNVGVAGFQAKLQEQESSENRHGTETIAYIAWEPSSGRTGDVAFIVDRTADIVNHEFQCIFFDTPHPSSPAFLAHMQTTHGEDTATLRHANKDEFAVDVRIQEETSGDSETAHTTEVIGHFSFCR